MFAKNTSISFNHSFGYYHNDAGGDYEDEISIRDIYIIVVFNSILAFFGSIGNILASVVLARGKKTFSTQNILLLNLAVADLCVLILSFPLWAFKLLVLEWPFGEIMCKVLPALSDLFHAVSLASMVAIAIVRYRAIVHALDSHWTKTKVRVGIVLIWMIGFVTASIPVILSQSYFEQKVSYSDTNSTAAETITIRYCGSDIYASPAVKRAEIFLGIILWYVGPLLVILLTLLRIHFFFKKQIQNPVLRSPSKILVKNRIGKLRKALWMLTTVVVSFAILMFPWNLIKVLSLTVTVKKVYELIAGTLLVLNSFVNPIIYYLMSADFRVEFKKQFLYCKVRLHSSFTSLRKNSTLSDVTTHTVRRVDSLAWNDATVAGSIMYETLKKRSVVAKTNLDRFDFEEIKRLLKEDALRETRL